MQLLLWRQRSVLCLCLGLAALVCLHTSSSSSSSWGGSVTLESLGNSGSLATWQVEALPSVLRVDQWPHGIRFAQWNHTGEVEAKQFQGKWIELLQELVPPGCNMVDIGAHGGDTTLPLAVLARGGTVVAFEMGPPFDMLEINKRLNPHLKIDSYKLAVSDTAGKVYYDGSDCEGCNGGISEGETGQTVDSVRLVPFLLQKYSREFVSNICLVKMDTEGYDSFILADFPHWFRPRVVWAEWYALHEREEVRGGDGCTEESRSLFNICRNLGYSVYQTVLPLLPSLGCSSYQPDLLLMSQESAASVSRDKKLEVVSMSPGVLQRVAVTEVVTRLVPVYGYRNVTGP